METRGPDSAESAIKKPVRDPTLEHPQAGFHGNGNQGNYFDMKD